MPSSLPDSPSVDKLREQARQLQRRVRAADPDALGFLTQWHPRPDRAAPDSLALHDAQLAVARRYGFAGWPALVGYVETAGALSRDPAARFPDVAAFRTAVAEVGRLCGTESVASSIPG